MEIILKSRKLNKTFIFFKQSNADSYIYDSSEKPGTLGAQICAGGAYMGDTLSANDEQFVAVCKKWLKQRVHTLHYTHYV